MKPYAFKNEETIDLEQILNQDYTNHYTHRAANLQSLKHYLTSFGPVPNYSSYLGTCDDGLPLFIDLGDASPGSLLIIGNEHENCIPFLRNILASTISLNHQNSLQCSVITPNIGNYSDLAQTEHMENLLSSYESSAHQHVVDLAILAEQRRSGRHIRPIHLLIIDDITEILKYQDFETANHLGWLASNGPKNSVWLVASIAKSMLEKVDKKILRCFGTYIFNNMYLSPSHLINAYDDDSTNGYSTHIGNETLNFHLPMLV